MIFQINIFIFYCLCTELSCATFTVPAGFHVVMPDGFFIGSITENGVWRQITKNGLGYKTHTSRESVLPLNLEDFETMMKEYISHNIDKRIVFPRGHRLIVDYFIIGVVNQLGHYEQLTINNNGVQVHVSGQSLKPLGPFKFLELKALASTNANSYDQMFLWDERWLELGTSDWYGKLKYVLESSCILAFVS